MLPSASGSSPVSLGLSFRRSVPICFHPVKIASGRGPDNWVSYIPKFLRAVMPAHSTGIVPEMLFLFSCRLVRFTRLPIEAGKGPCRPVVTALSVSSFTRFPITWGRGPVRSGLLPRLSEVMSVNDPITSGSCPFSPNPLRFSLVIIPSVTVTPPQVSIGSAEFQFVFFASAQFVPLNASYKAIRSVRRGFSFWLRVMFCAAAMPALSFMVMIPVRAGPVLAATWKASVAEESALVPVYWIQLFADSSMVTV